MIEKHPHSLAAVREEFYTLYPELTLTYHDISNIKSRAAAAAKLAL